MKKLNVDLQHKRITIVYKITAQLRMELKCCQHPSLAIFFFLFPGISEYNEIFIAEDYQIINFQGKQLLARKCVRNCSWVI